ncbi:MAG: hypothetical protein M1812_006047 [Candelaria pacifica]|nr:MAG: hypothetical protein M1812_006047 [Candelaria pacifica]
MRSTSSTTERTYGKLLAPYLSDPTSIFIISSDFCHWGLRFNYTYYLPSSAITTSSATSRSSTSTTNTTSTPNIPTGYNLPSKSSPPSNPPIHESISQLDNLCIRAIESGKYTNFNHVIRETGNTVCGRHPIGIILAALEVLEQEAASGDEVNEEDADGKEDENEETIDDEKGIRKEKGKFQFIHYSRSSDCVKIGDSSVSYASAFAIL